MGFKNFFSSEGKEQRTVQRAGKKLLNKYQQTQERKRAIDILAGVGSEEAIVALLKRYQFRTESTIVDEDEKETVFNVCVNLGERAVPGRRGARLSDALHDIADGDRGSDGGGEGEEISCE